MKKLVLALCACASIPAMAQVTNISLEQLHENYEDGGSSSLNLPEFGQKLKFKAVVAQVGNAVNGGVLLQAAAPGGNEVLARLTPANDQQAKAMKSLKPGATFTATCELGMTTGSSYMAMQDCVIGK